MIRLTLILLLLLISLLAVFRAPAYPLWLLSVIVQTFPWIFAGLVLVLLVTGGYRGRYGLVNSVACALALVLYLSPVIRAYGVANRLGEKLDRAFGVNGVTATLNTPPFRWWRMFGTPGSSPVPFRTLTYGSPDGVPLTLDLYPARRPGVRPCIIVVHGGSWSGGDSRQLPELNSLLARKGYNIAAINYRLAPRYQSPQPVEDVATAFDYLRRHAAELSIDTNAFVLLGRSAGAQIALLAAYTLPEPGLKGVIDFYGPADMVWGYSIPANPLIMDSRKVMSDYLGGSYEAVPQHYQNSSPIAFVTPNSVPTLILHGQQDVLVAYGHSTRLSQKLTDSGVPHFLLSLPWATHGFDYNLNGPGGQLSTFTIERFLQEVAP